MKTTLPFGLFVLGNPVLICNHEIRFRDRCYVRTMSLTKEFVPKSLIVARTREHKVLHGFHPPLEDVGAELALALPDYGIGGWRGFIRTFIILTSPTIRRSLKTLVEQAEFIYVERGTNPEAFLTAQIGKQMKRYLILEMRGSVLLNRQYLRQRFGLAGLALLPLHHAFSSYIRKQCLASLYINKELIERYPIVGALKCAISDAYLPHDFWGSPRHFKEPARRYLYVGHLRIVKRVDLIIKALGLACKHLPPRWHFNIVGLGPKESELKNLVDLLRLGDHVTFHGCIQWGQPLVSIYQKADVLLMASTSEGASRSLVEAMAFGLPVISTSVGNAPELLDESVLVPVDDVKTYVHRLIDLVNDPGRLTLFSEWNWRLAQNFRQSILEPKCREFWKQAIELSRRDCDK